MSIRQGKPGGFASLFIIKVHDDEVVVANVRTANAKCGNGTTLFCPSTFAISGPDWFNNLFLSVYV